MGESHNVEQKKTNEFIPCDSIYMKFKNEPK